MVDISAHLAALQEGVLVRAEHQLATIVVTGDDRQSWLAGMLTADLSGAEVGAARYALSVNKAGRIQAELWVLFDETQILLAVRADLVAPLLAHLDRFLIMEDAEVVAAPRPYNWWLAHGPHAAAVASRAEQEGAVVGQTQWGELPTAVIAAPQTTPTFGDALLSVDGAVLATAQGWARVRIERMLPRFGVDFEVGAYPQEASLENLAVSFNKGCYIGQEAVFMLEKRGHVQKRLVRLVSSDGQLAVGASVSDDQGKHVGTITSAVPVAGGSYALAMVRYKHTVSGTQLHVGGIAATVSCLSQRAAG